MSKIFDYADREFGLICCGEMIMRLSPLNNEMLIQGNLLTKQMGGAEFNVASSVSTLGEKCLGTICPHRSHYNIIDNIPYVDYHMPLASL